MIWGVRRGKNLQKEACRDKPLSISEARKSELESGESEQADEVIDGQVHRQAKLKALSGFTGHAQKDSVLQFPAEMTVQAGHSTALYCNFSTSYANPYISWYQQRQSQPPQMLLWVWKWKPQVDSGRFSSVLSAQDSQVLLRVWRCGASGQRSLSLRAEPTSVPSVCSTAQEGEVVPWGATPSPPLLACSSKLILPRNCTLVLW